MYARIPTATIREPLLSSTEKSPATTVETHEETLSFTITNAIFVGNVPTVYLPSSAEEVSTQIYMVGQPKNHISDLQFEKFTKACNHPVWEDEFHNRSVFWFQLLCGINALHQRSVEMATSAYDLNTSR